LKKQSILMKYLEQKIRNQNNDDQI
jgi:hypothetical protein